MRMEIADKGQAMAEAATVGEGADGEEGIEVEEAAAAAVATLEPSTMSDSLKLWLPQTSPR